MEVVYIANAYNELLFLMLDQLCFPPYLVVPLARRPLGLIGFPLAPMNINLTY